MSQNSQWSSGSFDLEALVRELLYVKRELDEMKVRVNYLEDCLLLPEEKDHIRAHSQQD